MHIAQCKAYINKQIILKLLLVDLNIYVLYLYQLLHQLFKCITIKIQFILLLL